MKDLHLISCFHRQVLTEESFWQELRKCVDVRYTIFLLKKPAVPDRSGY